MDQAEQLRKLVQNQDRQQCASRVITITSGKGGVGKTSIAINLALALSRMGKKVVVLDADFGLANIEIMMGIRPKYTLADLMFRSKELKDIITDGPENIKFISAGSGINELAALTREQVIYLTNKLSELDEYADYILVDTGAGISASVLEFVASGNEVVVVVTPEPTSMTDAYALLKALCARPGFRDSGIRIHMLSNRVSSEAEGKGLFDKMKMVVDKFLKIEIDYAGMIPQDAAVLNAIMKQNPFIISGESSAAARAVNAVAHFLDGSVEKLERKGGITRIFSDLIRIQFKKK